jgi:hypothetical protein
MHRRAAILTNFIVLALTKTGFELTIYRIQGKMLSMTPPIWLYAEMRIAISSRKELIQVRFFKFVNDNSNSTNLKVNLLYKT